LKNEIDPKIAGIVISILAIVIVVGAYFAFFRQGPAPDITRVKGKSPPGWKMPTGAQGPAVESQSTAK
jgi:hypothetical protein